ncbi:hypothetical protein [Luteipulveratus mongoliensis]|uniref:Uncharacterized protein n=1 Tax=Luteipulveratus mongoliensis TaxID=571913 RepID=A0A0K1JLM8_9MICO|nr:hypothetical protein [Luteipulveratus mongoliensis]AKU17483.1 hypothetical protein VV02_19295 [Luteipulveratus mongoliensis]
MSRLYYRRRFLNRRGHHAGAYAIAQVDLKRARGADPDEPTRVDADLHLADCHRMVTLDFYADDRDSARNALHKARLLREIVNGFVDAFEEAVEEADLSH